MRLPFLHARTPADPALRQPFHFAQAWRMTTFLLVFVGFLALAFTGEIHPLISLLFIVTWTVGIAVPCQPPWWRRWMSLVLMWVPLLLIGFCVLDGRFESLLYLLMFLALFKCVTLHEPYDHLQAMLMAFFMLLACTIITTSATYILFMLLFIVLAALDLLYMTIARERDRSTTLAPDEPLPVWAASHTLGRRLVRSAVWIGITVLVLSYVLFLMLPHYATAQKFSTNPFGSPEEMEEELISGYSDDLTLRNIDNIQLDEEEVMEVQAIWPPGVDTTVPPALRLRGTVLDIYDGVAWRLASQVGNEKMSELWRQIDFETPRGNLLELRINQNVNKVERLFAAPTPIAFKSLPRGYYYHLNYLTRSVKISRYQESFSVREDRREEYVTLSDFQPESTAIFEQLSALGIQGPRESIFVHNPDPLSTAATTLRHFPIPEPNPNLRLPAEVEMINIRLPSNRISETIVDMAHRIGSAEAAPDKVLQLLNWFRTDFEYTLQPRTGSGAHPLETFLTRTHRGHCEYFASSLVLMLRALHIPARVALGFYTTEYDPATRAYTVRQSDAHTWAEVWLDGYGWLTIDPTPSRYRGRQSILEETPSGFQQWSSMLKLFWQRYVLDYSRTDQLSVFQAIARSRMFDRIGSASAPIAEALSSLYGGAGQSFGSNAYRSSVRNIAALLGAVVLVAGAIVACALLFRRRRVRRRQIEAGLRSPVEWINHALDRLEKLGWARSRGQTVPEFFTEVDAETGARWQLATLADLYQRVRFNGLHLTPDEHAGTQQVLHAIGRQG